ncbi:MAG: hypothetical protein JO202_19140 [Ktedonobacteraceae bacterium]|nr:hypothetical protein [Ktedonobacteraceae bacterium]
MSRKKQQPLFEPWSRYAEDHEIHDQQTQPLPVTHVTHPPQETLEQRYRRLKALSDATGIRFLFVYLHDQGRMTIEDIQRSRGKLK